jgi:hypothetical protein
MSATDNTVDDEGLTTALRESPFNRRRDLPHAVVVVPPDEDLVLDPNHPMRTRVVKFFPEDHPLK